MKKFVYRILSFTALALILAYFLNKIIDKGLQRSTNEYYKEWNDLLSSKINADVIIQGTSRAFFHFSPALLDSILHMNSYNLGLDGWPFHMQYHRFKLYMKYNEKPKYIIQNVDPFTLSKRTDLFKHTQFLPYLNDPIIREAVSSYNGLTWKDYYIPLYKYRSYFKAPILGLTGFFGFQLFDNGRYKGFQPQYITWDSSFVEFKRTVPNGWRLDVDSETIVLFKRFLDTCQQEGINVILVNSPEYFEAQILLLNRDSIMDIFKDYALTYNLSYLDYSKDSLCFHKQYFYNSQHLNNFGVELFNLQLAKDLNGIIVLP